MQYFPSRNGGGCSLFEHISIHLGINCMFSMITEHSDTQLSAVPHEIEEIFIVEKSWDNVRQCNWKV